MNVKSESVAFGVPQLGQGKRQLSGRASWVPKDIPGAIKILEHPTAAFDVGDALFGGGHWHSLENSDEGFRNHRAKLQFNQVTLAIAELDDAFLGF